MSMPRIFVSLRARRAKQSPVTGGLLPYRTAARKDGVRNRPLRFVCGGDKHCPSAQREAPRNDTFDIGNNYA